jgi:hypothetical protein
MSMQRPSDMARRFSRPRDSLHRFGQSDPLSTLTCESQLSVLQPTVFSDCSRQPFPNLELCDRTVTQPGREVRQVTTFYSLSGTALLSGKISARKDDPQPRSDLTIIDGDALSACFNEEVTGELR